MFREQIFDLKIVKPPKVSFQALRNLCVSRFEVLSLQRNPLKWRQDFTIRWGLAGFYRMETIFTLSLRRYWEIKSSFNIIVVIFKLAY